MKEITYHHTATARGYVPVEGGYDEPYNGRFGRGYIKHYPNKSGLLNGCRSNTYHRIEYYIFDNK